MMVWKRAALLGFASWAIPFFVSFLLFPLKRSNAPLFETLMTLVVLVTAGALFQRYFRDRAVSVQEALFVGLLWLAVNLSMDYPMFAYGPMKMQAGMYYAQIGLDYLTFPAFGWLASRLAVRHNHREERADDETSKYGHDPADLRGVADLRPIGERAGLRGGGRP